MSRSNPAPHKQNLHPKNAHRSGYNFAELCQVYPALNEYLIDSHQQTTINFADPNAVIALNSALLKAHYRIDVWQIPKGYLCPPIPGRVDYVHYLAELLETINPNLDHSQIRAIDIGTGASCIYPILGQRSYQWRFTACDIDPISIACAQQIVKLNKGLAKHIKVKLQRNREHFFQGVINDQQKIDITLCNPPFHTSLEEALRGNQRKQANLDKSRAKRNRNKLLSTQTDKATNSLNFGGQQAELFCDGGELKFIQAMIKESTEFKEQVLYFSCLVSKSEHLAALKKQLHALKVKDLRVVNMSQGQKVSRFIAWSFHEKAMRQQWLPDTKQ